MRPPSPLLLRALRRAAYPPKPRPQIAFPVHELRHSSTSKPETGQLPASVNRSGPAAESRRGPASTETTQTDFAALNVLGSVNPPSTAIETCSEEGFLLDNGIEIGRGSGCLLLQGEAFQWRPWIGTAPTKKLAIPPEVSHERSSGAPRPGVMLNTKGQWEVDSEAWGLLACVWPKPELLILGLGASIHPLSPKTKHDILSLGIRVDVQDTRNAAAQFNLLATERGVSTVAAALIPLGWRGR